MPAASSASAGAPPLLSGKLTASYGSLKAARDSIGAIVSRSLDPADTASYFKREPTKFHYAYAKTEAPGWEFNVFANDSSGCTVMDRIQEALIAAGWVEHPG